MIWTIYDHPLDYPSSFVARCFVFVGDRMHPSSWVLISHDLNELRATFDRRGLYRWPRNELDDPTIVETWT